MKLIITTILLFSACAFVNGQQVSWKEFTSTEGGFSVEMPKIPTPNTVTVNTNFGLGKSFVFTVKDEKFGDYLVAYSDSVDTKTGKDSVDKIFNKIRDGIILAAQGRLISEEMINLNKHKGREIVVERPDGMILIERFYLVGSRFYQLIVETKKSDAETKSINRFLNSFKLITPQ